MNSTGNELESNDILDFEDNTVNLDILMNADQEYWTDRLGNMRPTIDYALRMAGFTPAGFDFATGGVLKNGDRNKCVFNQADQTWYSWSGDLPYNVIAGSTPGEGWKVYKDGFRYLSVTDFLFGADPTFLLDSSDAFIKAINWAVDHNVSVVVVPAGRYKLTKEIYLPPGITLIGAGVDYWDGYRPDPTRLLKSWGEGTHLVFCGTGLKTRSCLNLHNARPTKVVGGVSFPFTDFTNNDSVNGVPATAKKFSVGVVVQRGSQLRNLRVMVSKNGIDGYNDPNSLTLGDDWDVGVWVYDSSDAIISDVQSVGYWRMAGWLVTENDGSYDLKGNPERTKFHNLLGQGRRGLIQRNSPQIDVIRNTSNTVTCLYNPSWTLTAQDKFTIPGSSSKYKFTGYHVTGNEITLTGITPDIPKQISVLRAPNQGNNFSGSVFIDCVFFSLDHTSGKKSFDLGIGEAGALEVDGYPMRNLKFINTKFQTVHDRLNTIWGDCRDVKLIGCEHENGAVIGYNMDETQGYTGNIRYSCSDLQDTCDLSGFNPRDMFNDYRQFPTRYTDGAFTIKNWRDKPLSIQWFNGVNAFHLDSVNDRTDIKDNHGVLRFRISGNGGNDYFGVNHVFKDSEGTVAVTIYGVSKNMTCGGNVSPIVPNKGSLGTSSIPWENGAIQTAFTITSDGRTKTLLEEISDTMLDAWSEVDWGMYKILGRIETKGENNARWHTGIIAQQAMEAFERNGLKASDYGFFCYDKWEHRDAVILKHPPEYGEDGKCIRDSWEEVIEPEITAGELYSIRYEEALAIEAALQRRNYQRLLARIEKLESK